MANSINAGPIATVAQAKAGVDTTKLITPYNGLQAISARGLKFNLQNLGVLSGALTGANANLSVSNLGRVSVPSKLVPGSSVVYELIANQSLAVGSGNLLGTTAATAWSSSVMPLFVYAVGNDTEDSVALFVSRVPHRTTAPVAANISSATGMNASTQGSFYSAASVNAADYEGNPCSMIGTFTSCVKSASDVWTVAVAGGTNQVINFDEYNTRFIFPTLQFGATVDHGLPNGGTPPNWTTSAITYTVSSDGYCYLYGQFNTGSGGAGGVNLQMTIPFAPEDDGLPLDPVHAIIGGNNTLVYPIVYSGKYVEFRRCTNGQPLLNSDAISNLTLLSRYKISAD